MMLYDVKFNMNAKNLLLNHYWLFLLEYFLSFQGGPWSKRLCGPYAYAVEVLLINRIFSVVFVTLIQNICQHTN